NRTTALRTRQWMIFDNPRTQAAEHTIAVLPQATEIAFELLIPVRKGAELGQVLDLVGVARPQAAAIGFLQGDQIEIAQQTADLLQIVCSPGVRQQMLPATGQIMPITLGADTNLNIETEQTQTTVCGQARRLQMMRVDLRVMQANDTLSTPAAHGGRRLLSGALLGDQLVSHAQGAFRATGSPEVEAGLAVDAQGRYPG